ncbi:hypothetical protein Q4F19_20910 [Sphingomonas sp. BIUV-7]|uniref:Lipoprotein n=1 Tax=Sphingomonas natans TaxID=3063330 RepID=A0ABT8YER8_9SPHN|nr:hypothetical protein [Sphingomonas sp. BIUV-7]MDO6416857.1 hypothetical protein [Sphingomonas sp. BIUV-7]
MTRIFPVLSSMALLSVLAGCATAPPRVATAAPTPAPPAPAAPVATDTDWRDLPLSAGRWSYAAEASGSAARFGSPDKPALVIRCDRAARRIHMVLAGTATGALTITTSYAGRDLPLVAGAAGQSEASLAAADPFLDRIAFSRGRVSYAVPGQPLLMVPAWAEPARVIEDCRSGA